MIRANNFGSYSGENSRKIKSEGMFVLEDILPARFKDSEDFYEFQTVRDANNSRQGRLESSKRFRGCSIGDLLSKYSHVVLLKLFLQSYLTHNVIPLLWARK
jgi:hypothetical protein